MVGYFFDTYALIETAKNSPNYIRFMDEIVVTAKFNLVELFYIILENLGYEKAKEVYYSFKECAMEIPDDILFKALMFRLKNRKKGFSYADCIGYIFALENNLRFLTGDDAFEGMENVEFVK